MAELLPSEAICLLYRRYLRGAVKCQNTTIKLLFLQQIRNGFRRNAGIRSAAVQRELVEQASRDLNILEDERHNRTLYINRYSAVSCMEWESRRTEWHFGEYGFIAIQLWAVCMGCFCLQMVYTASRVENLNPDIAKCVDLMTMKLETDNTEDYFQKKDREMKLHIEQVQATRNLERRILATFKDAPDDPSNWRSNQPSLMNPSASLQREGQMRPRYDLIAKARE
jgi:hypothetical protein